MDWRDNARCLEVGTEAFFPDPNDLINVTAAKQICAKCYVQTQCLQSGIDEVYGIWGGTTEKERQLLRRRIKRKKAVA